MKIPRPFHLRLILMTSLVIFFGIAITATLDIRARTRIYIDSIERSSRALTSNIGDACAHYLLIADYAGLDNHVQKSLGLPNIMRIQVMDQDGHALSDAAPSPDTSGSVPHVTPETFEIPADGKGTLVREGNDLFVLQPILTSRPLGWIKIRFSTAEIATLQSQAIHNSLLFSFACLLLSIFVMAGIISRPARVIRQLADFAHHLPAGRGEQLPVDRFSVETEQLGEALNFASRELERMRSGLMEEQANLQKALKKKIQVEADLRQFTIGLEQRVADEVERSREKDVLLMQQARFAMLGEMLMNISHQWRQPLNSIGLQVQEMVYLLKEEQLPVERAEQFSDAIMRQLIELSGTIDLFRKLNRPSSGQASAIMPGKVVRDTINLVKGALDEKGISINLQTADEAPLYCSASDLSQCLINIINNARDAILERALSGGRIDISIDLNSTGKNRIRIANNGGPIPADLMERIFDPYVTSKFQSQGVGLGLFIVRQTVEKNMKGSIIARNTGLGAEFVLEV